MNRTTKINIGGKEYILCYSSRVVRSICVKFGSPGKMNEMLENEAPITRVETMLFVIHELIQAGAVFAKMNGFNNPEPLTLKELNTLFPVMHPRMIVGKIREAITLGSAVSVEIKQKQQKGKAKNGPKLKLTPDRILWWGLHIGLDYNTTLDIPHGELLSLINEEQIEQGMADVKITNSEEDPFPDWE